MNIVELKNTINQLDLTDVEYFIQQQQNMNMEQAHVEHSPS